MRINKHHHKPIMAALLLGVWFSTSVCAQSLSKPEQLDLLFEQLLEVELDEAELIERKILAEWNKSGSAAMDLLFRRGEYAMEAGTPDVALQHFTALIDHAPNFAAGYNGRASAYYQLGLYGPAFDDLRQVLVFEKRHFEAMKGVAVMLEEIGQQQDALEVWHQVHALLPTDPEVSAMIARLEIRLEGETI
jgi:tetratricopeptide (TPR) repeat protein